MPSKKLILVTGSSGFIGSEVVNKLMNNKKVILYLLINKNKKKNIRKTKNIKYIYCSLLNLYKLKKILNKLNITDIIHCAWSGVSGEARNSLKQKINLKLTNNLLNAVCNKNINCFIALGSQAEYGSKFHKIYENSEQRPRTKYGSIKNRIHKKNKKFCT
jgi:nucleoside-diphosphate-sugar epimerase